jgi:hypothetical protein
MDRVSIISHKGKSILYVNYQNIISDSDMLITLDKAVELINEQADGYLQLTDLRNAYVSPEYMKRLKEAVNRVNVQASKRAVVGISSKAREILLRSYNLILGNQRSVRPFKSFEDAKDWLVN